MKHYLRIMRLDHWIKQLFILPGCVAAFFLTNASLCVSLFEKLFLGFFAACLIASANYVINEWLDAEFDQYHPTKKYRSVVSGNIKSKIVWLLWGCLTASGIALSTTVNLHFAVACVWLWVMGILYNVKPFRTKDIPVLDVLSESINNAIRLMLGWFIVSSTTIPPSSLLIGYWMVGAFLMGLKRFSEYRMIGDKTIAGSYRKSFKYYSEKTLLVSSFFYAMCSVFCLGIFLIKYRIELVLLVPLLIGLYSYYAYLSFSADSAVQKPEKLFHEKGLMLYCVLLVVCFTVLMIVDIPALSAFTECVIISLS